MTALRSSNWAFLVWPDDVRLTPLFSSGDASALVELLASLHVPCAVSPLHDSDVWTLADAVKEPSHVAGTPKKPHYHVQLKFSSLKSPNQVLDLLQPLHVDYVERVECAPAYTRYLCHLDDEDKTTYPIEEVRALAGFDTSPLYELTELQRREVLDNVVALVLSGDFVDSRALVVHIVEHELGFEYLDFVRRNSYFVQSLLR